MTHLKQGLPGNYYPGRAGEFPKATRLGLACAQAAITLQREKALKATTGKFKYVWLVFQGQHGKFFLQAVAPKTAQVSRANKLFFRFNHFHSHFPAEFFEQSHFLQKSNTGVLVQNANFEKQEKI